MCTIAGYAGQKRAAPILIDMLRREQFFDGGLSTGIATIHEGKLYTAKVTGDLDELIENTDAAELPGCVGIIHSRTSGNLVSHAHPFASDDGKLALVLNGTLRDNCTPEFYKHSNEMMQGFMDNGVEIKSAFKRSGNADPVRLLSNGLGYHDSEVYTHMIGEAVRNSSADRLADDMVVAVKKALEELPADIVLLGVHAELDGTITVGDVTRSMVVGYGDGETYLATSAIAFPEEIGKRSITLLPPTSVSQITADGVKIFNTELDGVRVEQVDFRIASEIYRRMEELLKGQKDDPKSLYDMPVYDGWRDVWSEPYVDCKYAVDGGLMKPYATVLYEALWAFHKEGRLHMTLGERRGHPISKFWID